MASRYKQDWWVEVPDFEANNEEEWIEFFEAGKRLWTIYLTKCPYCHHFVELDELVKCGDECKCPDCGKGFKAHSKWIPDCEVENGEK